MAARIGHTSPSVHGLPPSSRTGLAAVGRPTRTGLAAKHGPGGRNQGGMARSAVSGAQDLDDVVGSEAALGQQDKGVEQEIGRLAGQGVAGDGSIGS